MRVPPYVVPSVDAISHCSNLYIPEGRWIGSRPWNFGTARDLQPWAIWGLEIRGFIVCTGFICTYAHQFAFLIRGVQPGPLLHSGWQIFARGSIVHIIPPYLSFFSVDFANNSNSIHFPAAAINANRDMKKIQNSIILKRLPTIFFNLSGSGEKLIQIKQGKIRIQNIHHFFGIFFMQKYIFRVRNSVTDLCWASPKNYTKHWWQRSAVKAGWLAG